MKGERQKTILLVDDEAIIAMTEKMTLEKYGYEVILAYNGEQAVAIVEKSPAIDLILMDINLGAGMDGTEAAAAILERRDLPVVFLSSHVEPEVVAKTEKITSYGYVVKDSSATVLDASIKMAFKLFAAKISEKKKEESLRESETRFRVLFSGATDGILVADSRTKRFRYANPAICRMLGYTEEEFLRLGVSDIHPRESLPLVLAEFASLARGEKWSSSDLPCLRKDGSLLFCNISHGTMAIDGQVHEAGFFHDITARRRANDVIQESQLRLKAQYQGMPIPTFTWQKQGEDFELMDFNAAAKAITNGKVIEFIGRKAGDLYSNRKDILQDLRRCFAEGKVIKRETLSEHFITGKLIALTFVPIPPDLVMVHMEDITERRRAEEALQKNEERMRAIVEGTPHLFFYTQDAEANTTYVSPTVEQVTGHKVDAWLKRKDWFITGAAINQVAREKTRAHLRGEFEKEPVLLEIRHASGQPILLEVYEYPITKDGEIIGLQGVAHDITRRKQAESQRETALDALQASEARTQAMLRTIPDLLFRLDRQGIFLDYKADISDLYAQSEPTIIGKRNRDIVPADFADLIDRKIQDALKTGTLQTFEYQLPITGRGVRDYEARMAASGADEVTAIVRDITEQKRSEAQREAALEALQKSEERLRDILFSMADWVWEVDENGVFTYSSEKGTDFFGASRGDIIGKTPFDFMPADEAKRVGAIFSEIVANKLPIKDLENWNIGKNGERICLLTNGVPLLDEKGILKGYRGVDKDISERKRAEDAVNNALRFQLALLDAVPSPVFYKDANLLYIGGNRAFEQFIGLAQEQFVGKTVQDISPADLAEKYEKADRELLENPGRQTYEAQVLHADGTRHDVIFNKAVFTNSEGKAAGLIGVILDITESKQAEEALRQSEERFRTLYENSPLGLYRTTPDGRILLANTALIRMLGYSSFADLGKLNLEQDGFAQSHTRTQFIEKIERDVEVKGLEYAWKRNDGTTIMVRESARAIRDAQGKTIYYDGIVEDITESTESKRLTEALYGISQAMYSSVTLDELYQRIHGLISTAVPAENFFIALLTDDGQALKFPYYRDEKDASDSEVIPVNDSQSLTVEVLRAKKPLLLEEAQLRERYATGRNRVWGTAPKCWLGVPLLIRDEAIGVMVIQDYFDGCAYGQKDVALLESTAGQIAIAIARKRIEKALHESVEAFRGYFNMGTVGICVTSPEKGWIEVNDYMCRMLGYTRSELLRLTWAEMTHPDDLNADVALFNQVLAGQRDSYELEKRFIRKDGQTIHTLLYATCQRNPDGSVQHFLVSLVDISERKKAEILEQAVYEIARAADEAKSLDDLYRSVHRIILTLMPATNILIARYDEKEGLVSFPYFVDEKDPAPKPRKSGRGLTDYVLRTGKTLHSDAAVEKELERSGEAKRRGSPSACWLGVPLKAGNKTIGVIALDNYSDPKAYGEREKKILEYVSGQIANAIARKQAEEEIKRQLAEKEVLLKEVHHRIKNNIASIAGLISLRLQSISNPEAVAVLKDAFGRIDSMRILYDKLLLSEKYQDIPVKNYVESLVDTVMALFPESAKVTLNKHIGDFHLDSKRLFSLGIIINELLTNKMKYAFAGRKRGSIRIDLVREGNHVTLAIEDDGNVLPAGFDLNETKGFGLMLVKMLSQQLGGSFSIAAGKGTRCTVVFDL